MKKINFAVEVKGLDGESILDSNGDFVKLSKSLANGLVGIKAQDSIGQRLLAEKIYKSESEMDLEEAEFIVVEKAIPQIGFTCLLESQLKAIIKEAKKPEKA